MQQMYVEDLTNATEVVLTRRRRVRAAGEEKLKRTRGTGGSASRAAAGAVRIGNAIGSALGARRVLGRAEVRLLIEAGLILVAVAARVPVSPRGGHPARRRITAMVLKEGLTSVGVGLVIGVAGALALSRLVSGLLFNVGPNDPLCFAGSAVVLVTAAVAGCLLPARRATSVSPLTALRTEA